MDSSFVYDKAGGAKDDGGKRRMDLIPWAAVDAAAEVFAFGAQKYSERNYQGLAQSRLFAATMRHLSAWWQGEDTDPETGMPHLAHVVCDTMMLLEKELESLGVDDRQHLLDKGDDE
jgi:hypothetical protein